MDRDFWTYEQKQVNLYPIIAKNGFLKYFFFFFFFAFQLYVTILRI